MLSDLSQQERERVCVSVCECMCVSLVGGTLACLAVKWPEVACGDPLVLHGKQSGRYLSRSC